MADISMCSSTGCPLRHQCRRNAASGTTPDPVAQSYIVVGLPHTGVCRYFMGREQQSTPGATTQGEGRTT